MSRIEELIIKIEEVRELMNGIISEGTELNNLELIKVSQYLDKLLNEYYELLVKIDKNYENINKEN